MGNGLLLLSNGNTAHTIHRGGLVIYLLLPNTLSCLNKRTAFLYAVLMIHKTVSGLSWDALVPYSFFRMSGIWSSIIDVYQIYSLSDV